MVDHNQTLSEVDSSERVLRMKMELAPGLVLALELARAWGPEWELEQVSVLVLALEQELGWV